MLTAVTTDDVKRQVALAALAELPGSGVIGLGTGSTVRWFIQAVGERVRAGAELVGVATSESSRKLALGAGIPLLDDAGPWHVDLCVDGADEVSAELDLIKGGGGAHTREKIVNFAARRNVIVVDASKLSARLGERCAVPLEVLPFAHRETAEALARFGTAALRSPRGAPFLTDSGNYIYDLATGPIARPAELDRELKILPGVVETGLFCARADLVLVADGATVRSLPRPTPEATLDP
jgi:ribose 5-phosphate isomerase A